MRIDEVAGKAGVDIVWKPFLLGPIFAGQGWQTSPFNIYPDKGRNMWRDMERRAKAYGLAFVQPDPFPQHSLLASRLTMTGLEASWGEAFARGVYEAEFAHGLNISRETVLEAILIKSGADPEAAFARAGSDDIKARLKAQTEEAISRHIFGAPTFMVGDELFWGDDHLEQAIDWALQRHPAQAEAYFSDRQQKAAGLPRRLQNHPVRQDLGAADRLLGRGQQAFALHALSGQLAGSTDRFGLLARAFFRRLFVMHVALHLAEAAFPLHLLLQRLQRLVDVIVADENLNDDPILRISRPHGRETAIREPWRLPRGIGAADSRGPPSCPCLPGAKALAGEVAAGSPFASAKRKI